MKNKSLVLLLAVVLTFGLAACGRGPAPGPVAPTNGEPPRVPDAPEVVQPQEQAPAAPAPKPQPSGEDTLLTREQARDIALAHAAVALANARDLEVELDRERGEPVYEVDFDAAGLEYSYDIHARTGQILKAEKERD